MEKKMELLRFASFPGTHTLGVGCSASNLLSKTRELDEMYDCYQGSSELVQHNDRSSHPG